MGYLGRSPAVGTQRLLDNIESQFNGTLVTFDLRYGTTPTYPTLSASLIVSLGGVLQEPGAAYYVSSDKIVFSEAPLAGTECWILLYSQYGTGVGSAQQGNLGAENLTLTGELRGPSTFVIDPAAVGDDTGLVRIKGGLEVLGTTTTISSTTLTVADKNIVIGQGGSTLSSIDTAGIDFGSTAVRLRYNYNGGTASGLSIEGGNVGIGTTTPSAVLHVVNTAVESAVRIQGRSSDDLARIDFYKNDNTTLNGRLQTVESSNNLRVRAEGALELYSGGNNQRAQIDSSGGFQFKGAGTAGVTQAVSFNGSAPVNSLVITSGGLVGLGTSSPATPLDVVGNIRAVTSTTSATIVRIGNSGNNVFLGVENSTGGSNIVGSTAYAGTVSSNGLIQFSTNNGASVQATLDGSGRLGIGTTGPNAQSQLHVVGSGYQPLYLNTTNAGGGGATFFRSDAQALYVGTAGSSWLSGSSTADGLIRSEANLIFAIGNSEKARIDSSGRLGIGTILPQAELHVAKVGGASTVYIESDAGNNATTSILRFGGAIGRSASIQGFRGASSNIHSLDFYTYNSADAFGMRLTSTGLGIGTNNPASELDVKGEIRIYPASGYATVRFGSGGVEKGKIAVDSSSNLLIETAGAERARIRADGTFEIKGAGTVGVSPAVSVNPSAPANSAVMDSSGRLSLGTSSPAARLEVLVANQAPSGGSARTGSIFFNQGGNAELAIGCDVSLSNRPTWLQGRHPSAAYDSNRYDISLQPLGGNVGIGTTIPSTTLDCKGNITLGSQNASAANVQPTTGSGTNIAGTHLTLRAGIPTGSGASGQVQIFPSTSSATGGTSPATNASKGLYLRQQITSWDSNSGLFMLNAVFGASASEGNRSGLVNDGTVVTIDGANNGSQSALEIVGSSNGNFATQGFIRFFGSSSKNPYVTIGAFTPGTSYTSGNFFIKTYNSGTEGTVATFTNTGNVGIGTTDASSVFSSNRNVRLSNASGKVSYEAIVVDGTNNHRVGLFVDNGTGDLGLDTGSSNGIYNGLCFYIEGSKKATIDRGGRLLVGRSATEVGLGGSDLLQVTGAINVVSSTNVYSRLLPTASGLEIIANAYPANLGTTQSIIFKSGSSGGGGPSEIARFTSDGRLGIGTIGPAQKLEIQDGSISVGSSANVNATNVLIAGYGYILSGTKYGNTSIRSTYENVSNTAPLEFYVGTGSTGTAEKMRLTADGKLLVGTNNNSGGATIQAVGSVQASVALRFPANSRNGGATRATAIETISTDGGSNSAAVYGDNRYGSGKWVLLAAFNSSGNAINSTTSTPSGSTFVFCITDAATNFPTT